MSRSRKGSFGSEDDIGDEEKQIGAAQLSGLSLHESHPADVLTKKESGPAQDAASAELDDQFVVKWDDNDPLNPRTRLSKARKWLVTLIIASASLCV